MFTYLGNPATVDCVFSGNSAALDGGGAYNCMSSRSFVDCTFSANVAGEEGGGIFAWGPEPPVTNCILWGNSDCGGADESAQIAGHDPVVNYTCVQGWTGGWGGEGNIGDDPLFADADGPDDVFGTEDDDVRLLAGSPCIDAADNEAVPADELDLDEDGDTDEPTPFDLDGNLRFVDDPDTDDTGNRHPAYPDLPIVDMGAYEFQACPGDIDGDGDTDQADLGILLADWGCTGDDCVGDLDGDGDTDQADLGTLLADWGCDAGP
jgi:hypothetical protein